MAKEIVALAPTEIVGAGFSLESFERGLQANPDFIGCDAGSSDAGPFDLGSGETTSHDLRSIRRDLRVMLLAARARGIPLLIGSCGYAGGDPHIERYRRIVEEIAREENLHFRLAVIHAEQDKRFLLGKLREGRIKPLNPWGFTGESFGELSAATLERCERIVGCMGSEPYIEALDRGAEVILAGRSTDTSIFAALPLREGLSPGPVWHAAKILECAAAAVEKHGQPDCLMARMGEEHFVVEPPSPALRCTPLSVLSHMLYENPSPFHLYEPSGMLDTSAARYVAVGDRAVKVTGSRFVPAERYTVKLEGAEKVGYRAIFIGGIRDSLLLGQLEEWMEEALRTFRAKVRSAYGDAVSPEDYQVVLRTYGKDGVMGPLEPVTGLVPHEVGLIGEVVARDQELANSICYQLRYTFQHLHYGGFEGLVTNIAYPFAPLTIPVGPVYRFVLNHVVEPEDPLELFPMEIVEV